MSKSKRLFIFCDGTGQDGMIVPNAPTDILDASQAFSHGVSMAGSAVSEVTRPENGGSVDHVTNVLRLSRAVNQYSTDGNWQQIVFYQSGVGTEANFDGKVDPAALSFQIFGTVVASKIRDAYAFLAQNFVAGDQIFLFGFSRGAYTARKLAQLIADIGLLTTTNLGLFFNIWKDLVDGVTPVIPGDTRKTNIKCLGVWDTVKGPKIPPNELRLTDTDLPASVDNAFHAMSLQENRKEFRPTLITLAKGSNQVLKQIWFPGAHSDVGGSYDPHELADISLFWMVGEIKKLSLFDLDESFVKRSKQVNPDDWGASQPHNAYDEIPVPKRWVFTAQNRLDSGDITSGIVYHQSWKEAPLTLNDPYCMLTRTTLEKKFTTLTYADLNDFEKDCKDHWKDKSDDSPIVYDDISQLFPSPVDWVSSKTVASMDSYQLVSGGSDSSGSMLYVGHATYKNAIRPGKVDSKNSCIYICDGDTSVMLTDYEDLMRKIDTDSVGWYGIVGNLHQNLLGGLTPVPAGNNPDGTPLFSARGFIEGGLHCGEVSMGAQANIPYEGSAYTLFWFHVLVFKTDLYVFHNAIGEYRTYNDYTTVLEGSINSDTITLSPSDVMDPRVVVGLHMIDMNRNADNSYVIRVNAYVSDVDLKTFHAHIDTWSNSTLYNGALSWLKLSSADLGLQCGTATFSSDGTQNVQFGYFETPPTVFVGFSKVDIGKAWQIGAYATDISNSSFNLHVDKNGSTELYGCKVTWIAVAQDKVGVLCNTFSGNTSTTSGYSGDFSFSPVFDHVPTVFTALKKFNVDTSENFRVDVLTTPSTDTMSWSIKTWGGSKLNEVEVAFLALDRGY